SLEQLLERAQSVPRTGRVDAGDLHAARSRSQSICAGLRRYPWIDREPHRTTLWIARAELDLEAAITHAPSEAPCIRFELAWLCEEHAQVASEPASPSCG